MSAPKLIAWIAPRGPGGWTSFARGDSVAALRALAREYLRQPNWVEFCGPGGRFRVTTIGRQAIVVPPEVLP